jgi:hypothetical protein
MPASNRIGDRLIVWINNVLPRLGLQSVASMFAQSLLYVTFAWICGGVVTLWVYFVVSLAHLPRAARFSLRTSAPAMWFAPAIVLLSTPLAGAFAVSLFLVANATRQLISRWGVIDSPTDRMEPARTEPALMFRVAPPDAAFLSLELGPRPDGIAHGPGGPGRDALAISVSGSRSVCTPPSVSC